jgi:PAS domain-containing protein
MTVTTGARPDMFAADSSHGSNRAFEALFMSSTVAIVAIDHDGRVLVWNRGAERLLGWTEEEVVGSPLPVIAPGELADRIERLEERLAASRLPPHFLFNSLHAIHVLLRRGDSGMAASMLEHLSDILRHAVRSGEVGEATLGEEIVFLERYLEVQQARFGRRFAFRVDVEEGLSRARVPCMLLQPLVENALRHGFEGRREGTVTVTARRRESRTRLCVRDDGAGVPASWSLAEDCGVGLRATRARLRRLYGDGFSFEVRNHPDGGAEACVEIPWRLASSSCSPASSTRSSPISRRATEGPGATSRASSAATWSGGSGSMR